MPTLWQNGPRCDGRRGVAPVVRIIIAEFPVAESWWLQSAMWETISFQEWNHGLSVVEFRNIFVEVLAPMVRHTCTCWLKTPSYHSFYPSPGCTCLVNFVNWLNLSHLINSSHPLHRSPDPQSVRKLGLNTSNSMNPSHPLHLSPEPLAYANLVNCLNTLSSFPILVFCLQIVRELGQMFEYLPLDHPIFHPSPVVRELGQSFWMPLISDYVIPASSSISRMYVNLVNCLKTSYLIIPSHSLYPSRLYVNLINCFKCLKTSSLIIVLHCLYLSPARKCTWSIVWRPLWWSHPILSIRLVNLLHSLKTSYSIPFSS